MVYMTNTDLVIPSNMDKVIDNCIECGKDMLIDEDVKKPICDECVIRLKKRKK